MGTDPRVSGGSGWLSWITSGWAFGGVRVVSGVGWVESLVIRCLPGWRSDTFGEE